MHLENANKSEKASGFVELAIVSDNSQLHHGEQFCVKCVLPSESHSYLVIGMKQFPFACTFAWLCFFVV